MERRTPPLRPRTLKGARIVFNGNGSTMTCMIRNLTARGARLALDVSPTVPDQFVLRFDDENPDRTCVVRWRKSDALGVEFTD